MKTTLSNIVRWASLTGEEERQARFSGRFAGYDASLISPIQYKPTKLPVILLLSDSIVGVHSFKRIQEVLKGKAVVSYIQHPHNCKGILHWMDRWGIDQWKHYKSIFHYDGMHGFPPRVTEEEHRKLSPLVLDKLKSITPNILWGNCIPIPDGMEQGQKNSNKGPNSKEQMLCNQSVINRNKSIATVGKETGTPVLDLYSVIRPLGESAYKQRNNMHLGAKGRTLIGESIANELINYI